MNFSCTDIFLIYFFPFLKNHKLCAFSVVMLLRLHDPTSRTTWPVSVWLCMFLSDCSSSPAALQVFSITWFLSLFLTLYQKAGFDLWVTPISFSLAYPPFVWINIFFLHSPFPSYLDFTQSWALKNKHALAHLLCKSCLLPAAPPEYAQLLYMMPPIFSHYNMKAISFIFPVCF